MQSMFLLVASFDIDTSNSDAGNVQCFVELKEDLLLTVLVKQMANLHVHRHSSHLAHWTQLPETPVLRNNVTNQVDILASSTKRYVVQSGLSNMLKGYGHAIQPVVISLSF